ncbi:putative Chemotaxis protein [Pseudomonas sp. IT-P2]|jgi:hypothetical protein|uniref:hypothetical protein n=1 Tax=Pseudomonas sp. IT-P2 TaxID=3026456 RepID=UPI0039E1BC67
MPMIDTDLLKPFSEIAQAKYQFFEAALDEVRARKDRKSEDLAGFQVAERKAEYALLDYRIASGNLAYEVNRAIAKAESEAALG